MTETGRPCGAQGIGKGREPDGSTSHGDGQSGDWPERGRHLNNHSQPGLGLYAANCDLVRVADVAHAKLLVAVKSPVEQVGGSVSLGGPG
jgi:hypothetical protein